MSLNILNPSMASPKMFSGRKKWPILVEPLENFLRLFLFCIEGF